MSNRDPLNGDYKSIEAFGEKNLLAGRFKLQPHPGQSPTHRRGNARLYNKRKYFLT